MMNDNINTFKTCELNAGARGFGLLASRCPSGILISLYSLLDFREERGRDTERTGTWKDRKIGERAMSR